MSDATNFVTEFHETYGVPVRTKPTLPDWQEQFFRFDLLAEEYREYVDAAAANDIVGVADGLADMVYVIYGTALTYGIDLDAVLAEVHRSNMSKLGPEGEVLRREDGKVLKGADYFPPDIARVLGLGECE